MMVMPSKSERNEMDKLLPWLREDASSDQPSCTIDMNAPPDVKKIFYKWRAEGWI